MCWPTDIATSKARRSQVLSSSKENSAIAEQTADITDERSSPIWVVEQLKSQLGIEKALQELYQCQQNDQSVSANKFDENATPLLQREVRKSRTPPSDNLDVFWNYTFQDKEKQHGIEQQEICHCHQQQQAPCDFMEDKPANSSPEAGGRIPGQQSSRNCPTTWEYPNCHCFSYSFLGQDDDFDCLNNFYDEDLSSIKSCSTVIPRVEVKEDDPEGSGNSTSVVDVTAALRKTVSSIPDNKEKAKRKRGEAGSFPSDSALVTCLRECKATSKKAVKQTASLYHAGTNGKAPPSQGLGLQPKVTSKENALIDTTAANSGALTINPQLSQKWTYSFGMPSQEGLATMEDITCANTSATDNNDSVTAVLGQGEVSTKASIPRIPVTFVPPSVLASVIISDDSNQRQEDQWLRLNLNTKNSCHKKARLEQVAPPQVTPQEALERILSERGYRLYTRIPSQEASYDMLPSALQLSSYGMAMVEAVERQNVTALQDMLSAGLSPNPCNQFCDSVLDRVCKTANAAVFACFVEHGCELRVADKFGRTPLHHCCWSGKFSAEIASTILQRDLYQLFIQDKRGETPLEYVRPELAKEWVNFLESTKDTFFPADREGVGNWSRRRAVPLPDPPNAIDPDLAAAIASGAIMAPRKTGCGCL